MSMEEACEFLRITKPTLYKYVRIGQVPAIKMGRKWKFHRETLNDWLKERMQAETQLRSSRKAMIKEKLL